MNIADKISKITKSLGGSTKHSSTIMGAIEDLVAAKEGSTAGINNISDAVDAYAAVVEAEEEEKEDDGNT